MTATVTIPVNRIPFPSPNPDATLDKDAYFITIAFNGTRHTVQVDSGSIGIVVPQSLLVNADGDPLHGITCLGPAQIVYEPSGLKLLGCYYLIDTSIFPVEIGGSLDSPQFACKAGNLVVHGAIMYSNGKSVDGMGMFGIAFGRPPIGYAPPNESVVYYTTNPFLACQTNDGTPLNPSYLLSSSEPYITLGVLPEEFTAGGGTLIPLAQAPWPSPTNATEVLCNCPTPTPWPNPPHQPVNWTAAPVEVSVSTVSGGAPIAGTMLLDTGINSMLLGLSDIANWPPQDLPAGTQIAVSIYRPILTAADKPVMSYKFATGSSTNPPETPSEVLPVSGDKTATTPSVFVNTGIRVLNGYDYYFDSISGNIGFRARA